MTADTGTDPWVIGILSALLSAVVTGSLAIVGVLVAQRSTAKREASSRRWQQHRDVYVAFLAEQYRLSAMLMRITRIGVDADQVELSESWHQSLGAHLVQVELVGSQAAAVAARRLYQATLELEDGTVGPMVVADSAREQYRRMVQRDLDLPVTELPRWGDEDDSEWARVGRE